MCSTHFFSLARVSFFWRNRFRPRYAPQSGLQPERNSPSISFAKSLRNIEVKILDDVFGQHAAPLVFRDVTHRFLDRLSRFRPVPLSMSKVAAPDKTFDADHVAQQDPQGVLHKSPETALTEVLA